jgi:hypothetical protein
LLNARILRLASGRWCRIGYAGSWSGGEKGMDAEGDRICGRQ